MKHIAENSVCYNEWASPSKATGLKMIIYIPKSRTAKLPPGYI